MYATTDEQKQIIHDCFNGHMDRDCERCPAHYSNSNGKCCFGDEEEFDDEDDGCVQCPHFDDCGTAVVEIIAAREEAEIEKEAIRQSFIRRSPVKRTPVLPARTSRYPVTTTTATRSNGLVQLQRKGTVITRPTEAKVEKLADGETLFQRFVKDSVWGAGQGFFEMAAEFFRTHRLP